MATAFRRLCEQHAISPCGAIHVGIPDDAAVAEYRALDLRAVLFIPPDPAAIPGSVAAAIREASNMAAVCCAVADHDGVDALGRPCRRLDSLLAEVGLDPHLFNLLHVGAGNTSCQTLRGAANQLRLVDLIRCDGSHDLDPELLDRSGHRRSPAGDDAFAASPLVTMSTLGANGRFGNQLFQYMFLRTYAARHGLGVQTPPWVGQFLFGHRDEPVATPLPHAIQGQGAFESALADPLAADVAPLNRVDLVGHFQYHTSRYAPQRALIRDLFAPVGRAREAGAAAVTQLRRWCRTLVAIHLRRGDYAAAPHDHPWCYVPPNEWYVRWLESVWPGLDAPALYVASDEPEQVLGDFAVYRPITAGDLDVRLPEAPEYIDYHVLRHANRVAISNSTFSFHACMLNDTPRAEFVRPHRGRRALVRFDPWDDEPLWHLPR